MNVILIIINLNESDTHSCIFLQDGPILKESPIFNNLEIACNILEYKIPTCYYL